MNASDDGSFELSRRKLLAAAGVAAAASLVGIGEADADAPVRGTSDPALAPPVHGLHLQFGGDAASEIVVSWHALQPVRRPRVIFGRPDGTLERTVAAEQVSYTDAKSTQVVYAYHARLRGLRPGASYMYAALHDGAAPEFGTFRTGRAARFDDRKTAADLRERGRTVVGRAQRRALLRLRGVPSRSGYPPGRHHDDDGDVLRRRRKRRRVGGVRNVHAPPPAPRPDDVAERVKAGRK